MRFRLFIIFVFLAITSVARASHAASPLPSQLYWNTILHNTPMPKALSELIQSEDVIGSAQSFDDYSDYYGNNTLLEDPKQVVYFFFEKDIHYGTTMKLSLARNTTTSAFLSKETAESIPFSSGKLSEILKKFQVQPESSEASIIKQTLKACERKALKGEDKHCATSLESMIDFVTSKLGTNIRAVSIEVEIRATQQNYTIILGVKKLVDDVDEYKLIVCHRKGYGYAVFYCHTFRQVRAYLVPMRGSDKTRAKAVAICHLDTSEWNPNVLLMLKVKPGTVPVCHFLPEGDIAWVSNQEPT